MRDLCGLPSGKSHGISLRPLLIGSGQVKTRDFVIGQYYAKRQWVNPIRKIRTREFKLVRYLRYEEELYNLKNDPFELINLAEKPQYTEIKKQLSQKPDAWIKQNNDSFYRQKMTNREGEPLE